MFEKIKSMFQKKEIDSSSHVNINNIINNINNPAKNVCKTADIPAGSSKVVSWNNEEIALFNVDNQFYAISNACAHKGGPLGEGTCDGKIVTCPWHAWQFDVATGKCTRNDTKVKKYELEIINGEIFIK